MIVLDASVLIAFLDTNDAHHDAAVELLADAVPPLLVHPVTAAEVLVAPARRGGIAQDVWADLVAIGVEVDQSPIDPLQLAQLRATTGCKMPDCCVIALGATRHAPVATFDARLAEHTKPS